MSHTVQRSVLLAVFAAISAAACASAPSAAKHTSRAIFTSETTRPDSVVVRVVNHADRPITVYRTRSGTQAALGKVSAGGEGRFPLRAADVTGSRMTLAAAPAGSHTTVQSQPFHVERGQVAVFVVTPELGGSQVFVDYPKR
jgi:hypothetical protein